MKLFPRTLLFFIGVVVFQSTLTIFLVTGVVTRSNMADAGVELEIEASAVYENYNSIPKKSLKKQISGGKIVVKLDSKEGIKAQIVKKPDLLDRNLENILPKIHPLKLRILQKSVLF